MRDFYSDTLISPRLFLKCVSFALVQKMYFRIYSFPPLKSGKEFVFRLLGRLRYCLISLSDCFLHENSRPYISVIDQIQQHQLSIGTFGVGDVGEGSTQLLDGHLVAGDRIQSTSAKNK